MNISISVPCECGELGHKVEPSCLEKQETRFECGVRGHPKLPIFCLENSSFGVQPLFVSQIQNFASVLLY